MVCVDFMGALRIVQLIEFLVLSLHSSTHMRSLLSQTLKGSSLRISRALSLYNSFLFATVPLKISCLDLSKFQSLLAELSFTARTSLTSPALPPGHRLRQSLGSSPLLPCSQGLASLTNCLLSNM